MIGYKLVRVGRTQFRISVIESLTRFLFKSLSIFVQTTPTVIDYCCLASQIINYMRSAYGEKSPTEKLEEESPPSYSRFRQRERVHRTEIGDEIEGEVSEKERIIEQNIHLKEQIFQLSQQLEEILEKDKGRKRRLGGLSAGDDDNTLREKKGELRKQQLEIAEMKGKIYAVKRQLEKIYNNRNLASKEEQLRTLKEQLRRLDEEKESLMAIKQQQAKQLNALTSDQHYHSKIDDLKKELARLKEEGKSVNDKIIEAEKVLRKNHEQFVTKQERLRQLEAKVAAGKERLKAKKPLPTITPEMISSLQGEIEALEQERRENQKLWQEKMRAIDLQFDQKKLEEEKKLLILKEKEKEFRINELKIKELRKLVRHNLSNDPPKKSAEVDMSQFRHKRNIKYLDKPPL